MCLHQFTFNVTTMRHCLFNFAFLAIAVFVYHGFPIKAQSAISDASPIKVDVYYESLCSDSMRFIVNQLVPSYRELKNHINVTMIPYGKATHIRESETGPWQFTCQHGPAECRGNKAQACAIHAIESFEAVQNHQHLTIRLVGCAMSASNPSTAVPKCSQDIGLSEETRKAITDCTASSLGDDLLAANGDKTNALEPSLTFVPTIVLKGEYSRENQNEALNNFSRLICRHLTTEKKPSLCDTA
ncbi:GILT-like protein 1 [Pseudomyrmex gracilis]|uniref:GILT-like protein 1 n=1 Tax=Pseudomyrmex gracilis TaxID=219809 RepID=UPI000994AE6C|nr:GILT-like protein 1 [Pseudomyrmex gracilis]